MSLRSASWRRSNLEIFIQDPARVLRDDIYLTWLNIHLFDII